MGHVFSSSGITPVLYKAPKPHVDTYVSFPAWLTSISLSSLTAQKSLPPHRTVTKSKTSSRFLRRHNRHPLSLKVLLSK